MSRLDRDWDVGIPCDAARTATHTTVMVAPPTAFQYLPVFSQYRDGTTALVTGPHARDPLVELIKQPGDHGTCSTGYHGTSSGSDHLHALTACQTTVAHPTS